MLHLRVKLLSTSRYWLLLTALMVPVSIQAQTWQAAVGAQSVDKGKQVVAFLPNEIWIHAGDTVNWTVGADEIHTITFLTVGQVRLPFFVGCPGFSFGAASFDGSTCVSTPPMVSGQTFSVMFPLPGNFKLVCLVHPDMTGVVHVLGTSTPLPHEQSFYDKEASEQAQELLAELNQGQTHHHAASPNAVVVGAGKTLANGGGHNTISLMRFVQPELVIHAGATVEWTNDDPSMPHTITFGTEPGDTFPPAHYRTADGIQLELPLAGKVFLHRAAHARGQAVINGLDLGRVNFCAASFCDGTRLSHRGHQFAFPLRVGVDLPSVHT